MPNPLALSILKRFTAAWPLIAEQLTDTGEPWSAEAVMLDLAWWADRALHPNNPEPRPGRRALRARWNLTERKARRLIDLHDGRPTNVPRVSHSRPTNVPLRDGSPSLIAAKCPAGVPLASRVCPADVLTRVGSLPSVFLPPAFWDRISSPPGTLSDPSRLPPSTAELDRPERRDGGEPSVGHPDGAVGGGIRKPGRAVGDPLLATSEAAAQASDSPPAGPGKVGAAARIWQHWHDLEIDGKRPHRFAKKLTDPDRKTLNTWLTKIDDEATAIDVIEWAHRCEGSWHRQKGALAFATLFRAKWASDSVEQAARHKHGECECKTGPKPSQSSRGSSSFLDRLKRVSKAAPSTPATVVVDVEEAAHGIH